MLQFHVAVHYNAFIFKICLSSIQPIQETNMALPKLYPAGKLDLDEVCEMIADGCSLAQIGAKFDRSRRVPHRTWENLGDLTLEDIPSPPKIAHTVAVCSP